MLIVAWQSVIVHSLKGTLPPRPGQPVPSDDADLVGVELGVIMADQAWRDNNRSLGQSGTGADSCVVVQGSVCVDSIPLVVDERRGAVTVSCDPQLMSGVVFEEFSVGRNELLDRRGRYGPITRVPPGAGITKGSRNGEDVKDPEW